MTLNQLTAVYKKYCAIYSLPFISADEQTNLTTDQQAWINEYIRIWDAIQLIDSDPFIKSLDTLIALARGLPNDDDAQDMSRLELIEALELEDPNGDYSDESNLSEGLMIFDKETLLTIIAEMNYDNNVMDEKL